MSKTASCRNDYSESGFTDKRVHADAVDFWRVAISDAGLPERLLVNADAVCKEKHARRMIDHPVIVSCVTACRAG